MYKMIVTTNITSHLLKEEQRVPVTVKSFKDGEIYVKIDRSDLKHKQITLVSAFPPPAENLMETLLLLDALKRLGACIHLIITYFGYARQDRADTGEALAADVIAKMLAQVDMVSIIDPHGNYLKSFSRFIYVMPIEPFLPFIDKSNLVIVSPDKGAVERSKKWQKLLNVPIACLEKQRPAHDVVQTLSMTGSVSGKNVLMVDDIISTGGTIIEAAKFLKAHGALRIIVAATHGVFAQDALEKIEKSPIEMILVTNTLPQKRHTLLKVVNIDNILMTLIRGS